MADFCSAAARCFAPAPPAADATDATDATAAAEKAAPTRTLESIGEDEGAAAVEAQPTGTPVQEEVKEEVPALPSVATVEGMNPEDVLQTLGLATGATDAELATACCKRVRVLCREFPSRQNCEQLGAARIIISAIDAMSTDKLLVLQSLAALVNLCSGDAHPPRTTAVDAGAIRVAAMAIQTLGDNIEVGEMACLVVQNLCYGDDNAALERREKAAKDGAIEAVIKVMNTHAEVRDTCVASLRLCVDRMPALRTRATEAGAPPEGVKPITKEGGGLLSFRGGFGTSRRKAKGN